MYFQRSNNDVPRFPHYIYERVSPTFSLFLSVRLTFSTAYMKFSKQKSLKLSSPSLTCPPSYTIFIISVSFLLAFSIIQTQNSSLLPLKYWPGFWDFIQRNLFFFMGSHIDMLWVYIDARVRVVLSFIIQHGRIQSGQQNNLFTISNLCHLLCGEYDSLSQ